jgi:hypothetical protein
LIVNLFFWNSHANGAETGVYHIAGISNKRVSGYHTKVIVRTGKKSSRDLELNRLDGRRSGKAEQN